MNAVKSVRGEMTMFITEPDYPVRMPRGVRRYVNWFQAAYGWNPFEGVICNGCQISIPWPMVYRCYDCKIAMCQACLIKHCSESRQYNSMATGLTDLDWESPMVKRERERISHPINELFRDEISRLQARIEVLENE